MDNNENKNIIDAIKQHKIIAIFRKVPLDSVIDAAQALYDGGIRLIEVTFDQSNPTNHENTTQAISMLCETFGSKLFVGAGTVMTEQQLTLAHKAGAKYIISPDANSEIIKKTKQLGLVSIPGALTPTESAMAYNSGADFVKLFPAGELGLKYAKAVRAPLNHIPFLAVGGVYTNNLIDFLDAGFYGVGLGSSLVNLEYIKLGKFDKLTNVAHEYVKIVNDYI